MIDVRIGDARELIHELENKSIDCVVTSPPYWGLRDYKTDPIIFDGLQDCDHIWGDEIITHQRGTESGQTAKVGNQKNKVCGTEIVQGSFCSKCGAWRGQLGLEPTPELYIKHMLDFFNDVKIKLKAEGNCFVNLGDTYSGSGCGTNDYRTEKSKSINGKGKNAVMYKTGGIAQKIKSIPAKSLCMIPQRFAWGMIERGWILRNEIIWHKPNHMPESVTDRLTKAHEVIYHFVRQQKYYYNLDTIREPQQGQSLERYSRAVKLGAMATEGKINERGKFIGYPQKAPKWFREDPILQTVFNGGYQGKFDGAQDAESFGSPRARTQRKNDGTNYGGNGTGIQNHSGNSLNHPLGKNPGDVWVVNTQPYHEAHFATFPLELVRRPILAGCPENGTVLDPFAGSGTVGEFCRLNNRNAVLFELNPEYKKFIEERAMIKTPELSKW